MQRWLALLLLLILAPNAFAFTVLELVDRKGKASLITIHDGWARAQNVKSNYTYVLADLAAPRIYWIDMGERTLTDATPVFFGGERLFFNLERAGPGPQVAGLPTTEYIIRDADDKLCSRIFVWEDLPEDDLRELQGFFAAVRVSPRDLLPGLGLLAEGLISPCTRAELDALGTLAKRGLPVMRINAWGETTFRVTELRRDEGIPACMLALPRHYAQRPLAMQAMRMLGGSRRPKPPVPLTQGCP